MRRTKIVRGRGVDGGWHIEDGSQGLAPVPSPHDRTMPERHIHPKLNEHKNENPANLIDINALRDETELEAIRSSVIKFWDDIVARFFRRVGIIDVRPYDPPGGPGVADDEVVPRAPCKGRGGADP